MIWGTPTALWLLTLTGPLVGLFLYRRRAVPTVVPSLAFWTSRQVAMSGAPFGRRLRHAATLLVEMIVLILLVTALADPHTPKATPSHTCIIVDCSATMQTKTTLGTRLTDALDVARRIVRTSPAGSCFTVVRAGQFPQVLLAKETSAAQVEATLERLLPADLDADLGEAISVASGLTHTGPNQITSLISDFCGVDTNYLTAEYPHVVLHQVGSAEPNLGIVDLRMAPDRREIAIVIGRNHATTCPCDITFSSEHGTTLRQQVTLDKDLLEARISLSLSPGEEFKVSIDQNDSLPLDNEAFGVYPRTPATAVRLVSAGNAFLEQAILANGAAKLERVAPEEWVNRPGADVTILDAPLLNGITSLTGRFIVFSPTSDNIGINRDLPVRFWLPSHRSLDNADPSSWGYIRGASPPVLPRSLWIVASDGVPVVYEWPDPLLAVTSSPQDKQASRAIVFNFNLLQSELPFLPAFPVLLWDTIDYLTGDVPLNETLAIPTGSLISTAAPLGTPPPAVRPPRGRGDRMIRSGDRFVWQYTEQQGVYSYTNTKALHKLAINWMSTRSTAAFAPACASRVPIAEASAARSQLSWISWYALLIAVLVIVAIEWILFHSRYLRMD